jgi:pimeloyl-ACP methyl ester carboxylesterase
LSLRVPDRAIADCVAGTMHDALGYPRFAVHGGDWGAFIASRLRHAHPEKLIGIHLNLLRSARGTRSHARGKGLFGGARGLVARRGRSPVALAVRSEATAISGAGVSCRRGGHFAALEQPELLADEAREFFRPLRGQQSA